MLMTRTTALTLLVLGCWAAPALAAEPSVLMSPTGKVEVSFSLADDGAPLYSVAYAGKPVVAGSRLGLTLRQTGAARGGLPRHST
jgi:glucan 1,4-alpha-glucosidase